ncbi:MAG: sigma factor-like helix-turn-helix DNA-binding protein [Patescibacteria group bacterium]
MANTDRKIRKNKKVKEVKEIKLDLILELPAESNGIDIIEMAEAIMIAFKKLTPREEKILKMRFGLVLESYGEEHTFKQIAQYEGVSQTRVGQIAKKALIKLKHPTLTKMFGDWMDK